MHGLQLKHLLTHSGGFEPNTIFLCLNPSPSVCMSPLGNDSSAPKRKSQKKLERERERNILYQRVN